ncbi:MAG: AAA family ATPase [Candidatus Diapherotrites archaeon]|nr:AAA family ATPase [Candidatus Diapherotrites archaeon]
MWVGESLPFDEELLVFDGKNILREKIGRIVDEGKNAQVVTFDNDGRVFFSKIAGFIKHKINGKMLQITTKTGRRIRVTDKHSLFSLVENEITPVVPSQLVAGKSVVAVPAKIPNISSAGKRLNLVELFGGRAGFFVESPQVREMVKKIGYKKTSELTGLKHKYLYEIVRGKLPVDLKNFILLSEKSGIGINPALARIARKGARNNLPAFFDLSEEFFELVGLWVAEGDFNSGIPRLSIADAEIMQRTQHLLNRLGLDYSIVEGRGIVINNTTLTLVLKELGLSSGAFNKRAPGCLLASSNAAVYAFLKGYFSGDGTIRSNGRSSMVEATTVSQQLANDLLYLLLKLGIVANHAEKKEWTGSISHRVQIFGADNFKRFAPAGFIDAHRNSMVQEYINKVAWTRSNTIPIDNKIEALLNEAFVRYPKNKTIGKSKIMQALCLVDLSRQKYAELWKLVEADIFWDIVEKMEEVPYDGLVYDISVEPCQNFVAGFGGIFAHNSEKGIRKIFRRARQVAPCIVFFDEIDAIAVRRGLSADSHVTERVVNQLLTELDGIEQNRNVIFVAATNRVDLIDPGLLRPGRIDKLVKIGAPDEKGRLAILKVHTKDVLLGKDISLEELAKKTEDFSGADIEGLIREAALIALKENKMQPKPIEKAHLDAALAKAKPSVSEKVEEVYDKFEENPAEFRPSYVG